VAFSPRPPVNVALAPAVPLDALGFDQDWPSLAAVLDIKGLAQQLAYQSELIAADAQSMTLRIPVAQLAAGPHVEKVIAAVVERLGRPVDIRIEIGSASRTAAAVDAARKAEQQWHAEQSIQSDPFVQALLRDFDAAILPGSTQPLAKQITQ
jgi:DNA polymerase-3 subunit gamma/tau